MDPGLLVVAVGMVGLVAVLGGVWWFSAEQRARRLLASRPIQPVGPLRPGELARISGRVVLRSDTRSPFSDTPCAAFHLKIETRQGENSWRTVAEDDHSEPFDVVDDTGTCHVDPAGSKIFLTFDRKGASGTFDDPSTAEQAVLERYGVEGTSMLGLNRTLRYQEATLSADEEVTLLGRVAIVELDGEPVLTLVPDDEHGLVLTDRAV